MTDSISDELLQYFTNCQEQLDYFGQFIEGNTKSKRIMVIFGIGGSGKSTLLMMFQIAGKNKKVPLCFASGYEEKTAIEILSKYFHDFQSQGVSLKNFRKTLGQFDKIQAKVEKQAQKISDKKKDLVSSISKTILKTAIDIGLNSIPVIGPILSTVGGIGTDSFVDWLSGFLSKPEIELLLDPTKELTKQFLIDLNQYSIDQRVLLMIDTYEQIQHLDDWWRNFVSNSGKNVFFVIAGRNIPDWSRNWPGWLNQAKIFELKPMDDESMKLLVHRYYKFSSGDDPEPKQVNDVIKFSRGLPIVVNSAVCLWAKYQTVDFHRIETEVISDLVYRLMEGVPFHLIQYLNALSTVRWFNAEILRELISIETSDIDQIYKEIIDFPFIQPRSNRWAMHDAIREIMSKNLKIQDPARYSTFHQKMMVFFEYRSKQNEGDRSITLEWLYHKFCLNEDDGITAFQSIAEELIRIRYLKEFETIINDVAGYPLEEKNSTLWVKYYRARILHLHAELDKPKSIYIEIANDKDAETKLRAYALCDLGDIYSKKEYLCQQGGAVRAIECLSHCEEIYPLDQKTIYINSHLRNVYVNMGDYQKAIDRLNQQRIIMEKENNHIGLVYTYLHLKEIYGLFGDYSQALEVETKGLDQLANLSGFSYLRSRLLGTYTWHHIWAGRLHDAEVYLTTLHVSAIQADDNDLQSASERELIYVYAKQGKFSQSLQVFQALMKTIKKSNKQYFTRIISGLGFIGVNLMLSGKLDAAEKCLSYCLKSKKELNESLGIPEVLCWLANLAEMKHEYQKSIAYYRSSLEYKWINRKYFEAMAITGIARVKYSLQDWANIQQTMMEAKLIAERYEYKDQLAWLSLVDGYIAIDRNENSDHAFLSFKNSLLYALSFNRYMLDEIVSGPNCLSLMQPLIPFCLSRGEKGKELLDRLREWWLNSEIDDLWMRNCFDRIDHENRTILNIERIKREEEPGDYEVQRSFIEQVDRAEYS